MQTQRTILWVIFSLSLLLLWNAWQQHNGRAGMFSAPKVESGEQIAAKPGSSATPADGVPSAGDLPAVGSSPAPASSAVAGSQLPSASAAGASGEVLTLSNEVLKVSINTLGGVLERGELTQHRETNGNGNMRLFANEPGNFYVAQVGVINAPGSTSFPTHASRFEVVGTPTPASVTLAAEDGGIRVERTYTLQPGSYVVSVNEKISNVGAQPLSPVIYRQMTRDDHKPEGDTFFYSTFTGPVMYTEAEKFQKIDFSDISEGKAKHASTANDGWAGILQHYFVAVWIPRPDVARVFYTQKSGPGLISVGIKEPLGELPPGASNESSAKVFLGPQDQNLLASLAPGLELTVDYGFLTVIAKPIHWLLDKLHGIVGNWGWAIVLLTLIIKTIFFPLQAASYKSMARMKAVGPRLTALRERYGDDRAKLNQAMMELYKNEKINPLGGCLPIVVQIPVFISLYWVLLASVEMRYAPWVLWIQDLASPDPYYILPALMAVSMFVQVRLNPTPPDPVQAKIMMFMPLFFSVMFFFFPSGLVLYWLVNNLYSIAQQWVITRKIVKN
ncbi:MAG: membrane protein insertase YidC [Burkholderiaceae bacterium]